MSSIFHQDASFSQFRAVFDAALHQYSQKTGKDIVTDPLAAKLQVCTSPDAILGVLQDQAQAFNEFRNGDGTVQLMRKLTPVLNILLMLSNGGVLGNTIGQKFPPANAILAGIGLLLAAAKGVSTSYDALIDLFECLENYLTRLGILTEISSATMGILVKIMVELLDVLALAMRQIKQGRFKKFAKKLLGEDDIEAVLRRLDRLTVEESRMTTAQTMEVVHGLFNNMKVVMDDGKTSMDDVREALVKMQEITESLNKMKRDELQKSIRQWLSPPDSSTNFNIGCEAHHSGTAIWFTQGAVYEEWKTLGSLAWMHGKPGSGKSVLCSSIIQDIEDLRKLGLASLAYYYFDFKDTGKQDRRGLLSSLLLQLSARSNTFYKILDQLYSDHAEGSRQPSESTLIKCLKEVLAIPGQGKTYIIVDALDECPNNFGMPTPREKVLKLFEELVSLRLPHLHICVTSRPEVDIQAVFETLASHRVSLHDEAGQRNDIIDYVRSVVESDPRMGKWKEEDRQLVITTLTLKADGMFRWVFCQLDTLRRCLPGSIRRALKELPMTLDETYERTLGGIDEEKWEYAVRLFQCLAVSRRPLRVKELAEVLAVELDVGDAPMLNVDLRPRDADEAVLSACSTLVTIVQSFAIDFAGDFRVVQFSHYSVQEFLTSSRLQSSTPALSRFYISPVPAHTILAQSCICTLLQLDSRVNGYNLRNFPLSKYAASYWVDHAQIDGVASRVQTWTDSLFDPEMPHFQTWVNTLHWSFPFVEPPRQMKSRPLPYATFYGFDNQVERLVTAYRQDTNDPDNELGTPLQAALLGGHLRIAQYLLEHNANVDYRTRENQTPLLWASEKGLRDFVQLLLTHRADMNTRDSKGRTPIHETSKSGHRDIVELLLNHGADMNGRDDEGASPLHLAVRYRRFNVSQSLLERGVCVDIRDNRVSTPLHEASEGRLLDIAKLLLDYGADVGARDHRGVSPLQKALRYGEIDIQRLSDLHHIDLNTRGRGNEDVAAFHDASEARRLSVVKLLLDYGADVRARDNQGTSPLRNAWRYREFDVLKLFFFFFLDSINVRFEPTLSSLFIGPP